MQPREGEKEKERGKKRKKEKERERKSYSSLIAPPVWALGVECYIFWGLHTLLSCNARIRPKVVKGLNRRWVDPRSSDLADVWFCGPRQHQLLNMILIMRITLSGTRPNAPYNTQQHIKMYIFEL